MVRRYGGSDATRWSGVTGGLGFTGGSDTTGSRISSRLSITGSGITGGARGSARCLARTIELRSSLTGC
jgi:hypothetical protein